ncbi:hypothetical protein FLL45_18745 [Aliikangiella marina]|uniref:Uncharacterized protein n=1 Tax=Aliikangiella marina TaxID=1712262 RepID=A0A545T515_9GAMM|nr:hypothetical protein [Aliikangiella marina]TQV72258.1 hypothetical protein FLL45_18745 [Aliikangiella marina]
MRISHRLLSTIKPALLLTAFTSVSAQSMDLAILAEVERERSTSCILDAVPIKEYTKARSGQYANAQRQQQGGGSNPWNGVDERLAEGKEDTSWYEKRLGISGDDPILVASREIKKLKVDKMRVYMKHFKTEMKKCPGLCTSRNDVDWDHDKSYLDNLKAQNCKIHPNYTYKEYGGRLSHMSVYECKDKGIAYKLQKKDPEFIRLEKETEKRKTLINERVKEQKRIVDERLKNKNIISTENNELVMRKFDDWTLKCINKIILSNPAKEACSSASKDNPICSTRDKNNLLPESISIPVFRSSLTLKTATDVAKLWSYEEAQPWSEFRQFTRDGNLFTPPSTFMRKRKGNLTITVQMGFYIAKVNEIDAPLREYINSLAKESNLVAEKNGYIAWPMINAGTDFPSPYTLEDAYSISISDKGAIVSRQPQVGESPILQELLQPKTITALKNGEQLRFHAWDTLMGEPKELWSFALESQHQGKAIQAMMDYYKGELFDHIKIVSEAKR